MTITVLLIPLHVTTQIGMLILHKFSEISLADTKMIVKYLFNKDYLQTQHIPWYFIKSKIVIKSLQIFKRNVKKDLTLQL